MSKFPWLPEDDEANGPLSHCHYLPRPHEIESAKEEIRQQRLDDMAGLTSDEAWYERNRAALREKRAKQRERERKNERAEI